MSQQEIIPQPLPRNLDSIKVSLGQESREPLVLRVTIENTHPTCPFTVLRWGSMLDEYAIDLGIFKVDDHVTGDNVNRFLVSSLPRWWMPNEDDLVELRPGCIRSHLIFMDVNELQLENHHQYDVCIQGVWRYAWTALKEDITFEMLAVVDCRLDSGVIGYFQSPTIVMETERVRAERGRPRLIVELA